MSDSKTLPTVQIPRFKDKVMYIPASVSKTKQESSYVISSSFKGIVRLSPNNHNTTYEKADIQLSLEDDAALGTTYSDAIKFDNEAIDAIKSNADITRRMIIGSDSDGYLVNFRFSENNVEFDNLGVIGITEANNMTIYTTAKNDTSNILTLNGERMPYFPQTGSTSLPLYKTVNTEGQLEDEVAAHEWDVRDVKITGEPDNSYVVYGTIDNNNKRTFRWNQTSKFIKELILEALLDLQTIPTGSIHWFPVTLDQYKQLVKSNGNKPNTSFINGDETKPVDPLLRDFLLCDGRKYNNRDFPELAKILWKEPITRWKIASKDKTKMYPFFDTECNNYGPKTGDNNQTVVSADSFTFRVPDLRHMFISSILLDGTSSVASGKALSPQTDMSAPSGHITGSRCPDNKPSSQYGTEDDKHFHFISYGSYSGFKRHTKPLEAESTRVIEKSSDSSVNDFKKLTDGQTVYTFYLTNHNSYEYNNNHFEGFHHRTSETRDRWVYGVDAIPCSMILSTPGTNLPNGDEKFSKNSEAYKEIMKQSFITKGGTSESVASLAKAEDYIDINDKFVGSVLNNENYVPWKNYMTTTYGHENTPKFYCMLPFIKI